MRGGKPKSGNGFEAANTIVARIILDTPERFGGERAGLVRWARLVVEKQNESDLFELASEGSGPA
jgi:hypothetical protein